MKIHKYTATLIFIVCLVFKASFVHTQDDQSGFISIDCGIPKGSEFTDPSSGLLYISDAGFIDRGLSKSISHFYLTESTAEQYATVRSFPEGTRNCYTIPLAQGKGHRYLIRVVFMYGNYDGKDEPPLFDLYLGADFWDTVNITDASNKNYIELVHVPSSDYLHLCLVKIGAYTPFISTIELRLLEENMYATKDKSLSLAFRLSFPVGNDDTIRFKDDIYDRIWRKTISLNPWKLHTTETVDTSNETLTRPPPKVMSSAWVPFNNVTGNLSFIGIL